MFYLYKNGLTVEVIKLPCLDYVIINKKRGEVKSVLLHPRYDRELIYLAGVPFYPFHGGPEGRQTITSHHADHQIDRKERNQPCMKVLGLEK